MRQLHARALVSPALLALVLAGCGDTESTSGETTTTTTTTTSGSGGAPPIPDPVVNEPTAHANPFEDKPFAQDVATLLRTVDALPDVDVRSLLLANSGANGGDLYVGTASGLAILAAGAAKADALPVTGTGAVIDLAVIDATHLALARADGVEAWTAPGPGEVWPSDGEAIAGVAVHGGVVYVGTGAGLATIDATGLTAVPAAQGFAIRDLVVNGDVVWMATAAGVKRFDVAQDKLLGDLKGAALLADDDVRALAATSDGTEVLAATATGLSHIAADGGSATIVAIGKDALPNGDLRAVAEAGGVVFTGHGIGATAMSKERRDHYHSLRWLPGEEVTAVAIAEDGTRFAGTHAGLSRITLETRTLADKAAVYDPELPLYWRMDGIVSDEIFYADPWDLSAPPGHGDFDNDGLWTEMQIGAWCLAYAETKDESYYEAARKAMDTMFLFFDVPAASFTAKGMKAGFITRSLVRDDEGALFEEKASQSNWHLQEYGGRSYYWKDDTSSDEYAGHYFGIPLFHDLCAKTDEERKAISDRIASSTSYLVDNGYQLIDLDGKPTKFGRWDDLATAVDGDLGACLGAGLPNCASSYGGGGWLNSLEILGHLLAAWHITGDDKFYLEYERLAIDERYGDMVPMTDHTFTVTSRNQQNHSDHELASVAYFTLLRYEPNADRREKWVKSILDFYDWEKLERNALEIGVIASATADGADFADAARTLQEWLFDRRDWAYDNAHRLDVEVDKSKDRFDNAQFTTVLPYDEMRSLKWNGNPYAVAGGGSGQSVQGPWPFLLPYWMLRHAKAIIGP